MKSRIWTIAMAITTLLVFGSLTSKAMGQQRPPQVQEAQVPCFFIFGDSLVDNGNNNGMLTLARANYGPYGIDFPLGATGRFTNGQTYVDALARLLGFQNFIPPFARARAPREVLRGVNFASGAAGIREETGNNLVRRSRFAEPASDQLRQRGASDASVLPRRHFSPQFLPRPCIFFSGMGSNDYLNNYFMSNFYTTSSDYTPKAFASVLLQDYANQLAKMYTMGARKVVVTSVGQIGCIPYQLARYTANNNTANNSSRCNEKINDAVSMFNSGLKRLVQRFNGGTELPGAKFVYLDFYKSTSDLYRNSSQYGFEVIDKGCCGVGRNNGQITCLPLQQPCPDRRKYLFWDAFHPTELANVLLAQSSFSTQSFTYPINIQQLAMS
ncbi:unnamed protein product [Linum tenue]|uniref:Uncharacterized protein n=1 Tax=Linum tenue TaxID=586396 RepID=A0AAV0JLR5_9ROSI|nr:unnamed protein product [Linum tenue]